MRRVPESAFCIGVLMLAGCDRPSVPTDPALVPAIDAQLRQALSRWGVVPIGPSPEQNPSLVELGQALVFDKILSGNRDIACATCHRPSMHGTDGLSLAIGTGGTGSGPSRSLGPGRAFVARNAPSLLNQGLRSVYVLWDGRIEGFGAGPFRSPPDVTLPVGLPNILAAQAMLPVLDRREMRGERGDVDVFGDPNELAELDDSEYAAVWQAIMVRLLAIPEYATMFSAAFPQTPPGSLHFRQAAAAIAAFLTAGYTHTDSPFDRYVAGDDAALTPEAKRGALLFFAGRTAPPGTGANGAPFAPPQECGSCHNGPLLGGQGFANIGAPQLGPGRGRGAPLDFGRGELFIADGSFDSSFQNFYQFAFRIPPLRNVELTAPYMHDGAYATLETVVEHYSDVPEALRTYDVTQLAPELQGEYHGDDATIEAVMSTLDFRVALPFDFSDEEQEDLVTFLRSLTDPSARDLSALVPDRVPSGLPVER
jgi:cytochrome c peroxidase